MQIITDPKRMQAIAIELKKNGVRIGLVPTMGALHEGHLSLVRRAVAISDQTVVSVFVNPLQFGPSEDFQRYPRDLESDSQQLKALGVRYVFAPSVEDFYPPSFQTQLILTKLPEHLCGLYRPGHFTGVATVVCKLLLVCQPTVAVFGTKDYQQLRVIQQMVEDLGLLVQIDAYPTVREADGLAMSSRNAYLTPEQRKTAALLQHTLREMKDRIESGERQLVSLEEECSKGLATHGFEVEYLHCCDPETLQRIQTPRPAVLIATAARLGGVRLIDNVIANPGEKT